MKTPTNPSEKIDNILSRLANDVEWSVNPEKLSGATIHRDREEQAISNAKAAITSHITDVLREVVGEDSKDWPITVGGEYDVIRDRLRKEQRAKAAEMGYKI